MADAQPPEVSRAALRALAQDYADINWRLFGERLRPIPLALLDGSERLGLYTADPRRIALGRSLVLEQPWGAVLEVLKHEMAHQFVEEVLEVRDQTAHGPAFRKLCQQLGIDGRASGLPQAQGAARTVLQRVGKLLALADSPNPHEAETAMRTAQRLMLKHNLQCEEGEAADYSYRHLGKPTGRSNEAERVLASLLGEFFFVQPIWVSVFRLRDQKRVNVLEITGRHENLAMAEYVYDFLLHAAESLWRNHKWIHGITRNADRQAYRAGVIRGFGDKLRAERESQRGEGLVWVGDPRSEQHFERRHPRVRTTHSRQRAHSPAGQHGREAGKKLVLHRPLESKPVSRGRLLR